ncbi:MAG: TATA-box-binding protein [Candidatus Pacearchaeota archaeon]
MVKVIRGKYKIQNLVATTSLEVKIPLVKLAKSNPNTEYNPEQFPGLVLRIQKPKSAVLVFSSGNLVCTGTRNMAQVKEVIKQVIKELKKIGIKVKVKPKLTIQNIVASGEININLNLNQLSLILENTEYEPEQFPGLVYKIATPNATFLLFGNGRLVCTGTKNKEELQAAIDTLRKNLKEVLSGGA